MKKEIIKNRKGLNMAVEVEQSENPKDLVFLTHGCGGFKEQLHIEAIMRAFIENNYTVVRFDTTNSIGESEGKFENATTTGYYQDLEDIIDWAKDQGWYQEPFILSGHSLGGFCSIWFTINHPEKVKAIAPISPVVSGKLFAQTEVKEGIMEQWKKTGIREWESQSRPGFMKRLKYGFIEDIYQYDLLKFADQIKVPILFVVGELDESTPPKHVRLLYQALESNKDKEFHIINGAEHTFREEGHLEELKSIISEWVKKIK
ncbi:MAG: alpha/beta fold hydrolase [Candidatus Parcubacteria bacterium]|nr:alpha/beta fold hydrolase [Candidatus Parcubacteria bacterium]